MSKNHTKKVTLNGRTEKKQNENNQIINENIQTNPPTCYNTIYFINTFRKADDQLSSLSSRFEAHKTLYDGLLKNTKNQEDSKLIIDKKSSLSAEYTEKIEEIRNLIIKVINETKQTLTQECQDKLKSYLEETNQNIQTALTKIKI